MGPICPRSPAGVSTHTVHLFVSHPEERVLRRAGLLPSIQCGVEGWTNIILMMQVSMHVVELLDT